MKIFKKAISLVLVFAMLASFAGMTGYSPASIIAEAADTFTVGEVSVTMLRTLYKTVADGTEAAYSGNEVAGDYILYNSLNDLNYSFTYPADTTHHRARISLDGGKTWSPFWWSHNGIAGSSFNRSGATPWTADYSYFIHYFGLKGNGGYGSVDSVTWQLQYSKDDRATWITAPTWTVDLKVLPNTASNKPLDSKAGLDAAKVSIDMPPVLYMNGSGVITNSIGSSSTTTTLDTTLAITLPSGVTSATLKAVDYSSDSTVYKTWNLASGSNSVDFNGLAGTALTNGNPYLCLRLDYTMEVPHTPYNTPSGNVLDTTFSEQNSLGKGVYLDDTYNSDGSKSASDTVPVTYTQYIAAFVTTLPRYYQVGWQFDLGTKYSGAEQSLAGVIMMDMAPALATDGINLYGSVRSGESGDYANAALRENWLESRGNLGLSQTQNNALIWYNDERKTSCGNDSGVYTSGQFSSGGANSSNRTLGGTIYYDSTATSAVNINMKYDFTSSSYTCDKNELDGFWLTWYNGGQRLGWDVTQDGVAGTYLGDGISSHSNGNANDSGGLAAYGNVVTKTGGTYPNSGMNFTSSDTTVNFSFNLANATAAGTPYWRCVQQINRPYYSTWGMSTNLRCIWGFHVDAIAIDREAEHYVMTQAVSKNFVEAEMDASWWHAYRDEVLFAYYDCGDLRNSVGVEGLFDGCIADGYATDAPVYKTANFAELEAAILRAPYYDRGTSQRDTTLYPMGVATPGAGFEAVVDYKDGGAQSADPAVPNATYYNNDTAGNGISNIDNAGMYRYSGTYFYTDETWRPYATERYYALNILKYPAVNLDVFWYGAGYMYGAGGAFSYTYMQSHIDAAYDRLVTAYNNLELRTLAEFKMRNDKNPSDDYDGDGVADNVTAGNGAWMKDANGNQIIGYDAIMAYLASLIPTDTYTYYTTVSDANDNGKIDALDLEGDGYIDDLNPRTAQVYDTTQLEALLSQMQTRFAADQTVVEMGLEFESYIENFLALVEITKRNPQNADNNAWIQIFTYLNGTSVAGDLRPSAGLKAVNFVDEISKIYTLTDAQKNNFQSLIDTYNTAAAPDPNTYVTTRNALSQGSINTAIGNFFASLLNAFPSIQVAQGGENAKNTAKDPNAVFTIYAPSQSENFTESIYTSASISKLETEVAKALDLNSYTFALTTWQSLVDRKSEIEGWATVFNPTTNPTGMLESSYVNITELETALAYAKNFRDTDSTISVTSPDGKQTVTHNYYSAQSIAELNVVINEAQSVYDTNKATPSIYTNQLAIDKLTFALYEESNDAKLNLIKGNPGQAYRSWTYDAATDTATYEENWDDEWFTSKLYGVRDNDGSEEGLKPNIAYYEFLITELSTPYTSAGVTVDNGKLWDSETGWIKVGADGKVPVDSGIFNETWGEYVSACNAALELYNAYKAGNPLTADSQKIITDAAKAVYEKRNALQFATYNFDKDEMYETVKGYYATLSAYVQKTDITRYGYEYVYVADETTGELVKTSDIQESADPLSSVEQSVYIYTNVTPELEAALTEFYAKYASDAPTAKAGTWLTEGGGKELYDSIVAMTEGCEVKKTNDESLIAGMLDLTGRVDPETQELVGGYIAGTWTVTYNEETGASTGVYATDLLNKDQAGLLQTYLTNAQNKINSKEDATAAFGGALGALTTIVFDETKKPATNLQFAVAMRDQVEEFMNMTFNIKFPEFYNGGKTVTAPVFDQHEVNDKKADIDTFWKNYEWPAIYQIHGLEVQQATGSNATHILDNYFVTVYPNNGAPYETNALVIPSGSTATKVEYSYNSMIPHDDDEVGNKIYELFTEFGGKSEHYTQILNSVNDHHIASLAWIIEVAQGTTATIDGTPVELILADLDANTAGNEVSSGSKITVEDTLLTTINNATLPFEQWETITVDVDYDVRKASNSNYWYTEPYGDTVDGKVYYRYEEWFTEASRNNLETKIKTPSNTLTNYTANPKLGTKGLATTYVNNIKNQCWTSKASSDLSTAINSAQTTIYTHATNVYSYIRALELLKATEAYRDVYNTYLSVKGQHIADGNWNGDSIFSGTQIDDLVNDEGEKYYKFYNLSDEFVDALDKELINTEAHKNDLPPYGTAKSSLDLWNSYKRANAYENPTDNPWYNLGVDEDDQSQNTNSFLYKFKNTTTAQMITIDQAEKVNSYNIETAEDDGYKSLMEELIVDYLSKLELKENNFDLLDEVIQAFLRGTLQEDIIKDTSMMNALGLQNAQITSEYGTYYPTSNSDTKTPQYYYTEESLLAIVDYLRTQKVLLDNDKIFSYDSEGNLVWADGFAFNKNFEYDGTYKNSTFYSPTTSQETIYDVLRTLANKLANDLDFNPVDTDGYKNSTGAEIPGIEQAISAANDILANKAKYDTEHTRWNEFITAKEAAEAIYLNEAYKKYNITDQQLFDDKTSALLTAILNLKEALLADNYAPSMTLKTSVSAVKEFYSKEAYAVQLSKADSVSYTGTGETLKANPAAGTFFVPNSSGYSLIVYTNELNPRIVINLEDIEQVLEEGVNGVDDVVQDAAKQEYISINAKKTSDVTANVIAGTIIPANNGVAEIMTVDKAAAATATQAVVVENKTATTDGQPIKGSSAFAILAPTFVSGKSTQAAVYTIEARDGSARSVEGGTEILGNPANKFDFGTEQEPIGIKVYDTTNSTPRISIYVYYYGLKAADGTEEGINATGTALATPAISGTHVPSALLSGEPGFKGTDWRNGILLQRHFSDSHRVWEYVSEIKKNEQKQYNVNGTQVPLYNDPTFDQLNTGSFYYVLDENVAADAEVIAAYDADNDAATGCMDYDRATAAKELMISKINAEGSTVFADMKDSGRLYNYGDYYTKDNGEVKTYDNGEPQWINWAQSLNNKVENGDLIFVHVVDRWGNVVNRIVEITNLDKVMPTVVAPQNGKVEITETASGVADITIHNGDFSLGEIVDVEYKITTGQNVTINPGQVGNATVSCSGKELTISGVVPGRTYYIKAIDNAGNANTVAVKAGANDKGEGIIVLKINNSISTQTGEDMGFDATSTFTLNGTDTIILNSGEASSVINADIEGNVFANRLIKHLITTLDTVTGLKTVYQDGTVEEWTSSNARVKDNGDGTLTWTIGRNFAEGEHNYKVYAKVDGEYEKFYAPANFFATNKSVRITYRVSGPGNTVLVYGGASGINNPNYNSLTVPYGSKVTITAETNIEGCEFYYWINNTTDRIISTANVLEFKAVANVDYIAQFTNNSTYTDGKKFVVYVNNAKNVIERFELADGESYTVPTGPVLPDYTFMGWSMTKAQVLESDKDTIIVEPIYELNASNTVTITEGNYTATGAGTYTAQDNQRAVVTISTSAKDGDGKEFLYWLDADTEEIISYDRTYSFFCVKDTELTPVYGDASTITAEPIVRITEVKFNALSGKVSFFAERSVPEEFMILQTGIVVTKTESIGTNEEVFVVGGTSTAAGTSTSTANNGYYSANTAVATGQTVWARAYVIYETADGEIFEAYGPVVSYTVD